MKPKNPRKITPKIKNDILKYRKQGWNIIKIMQQIHMEYKVSISAHHTYTIIKKFEV